MFKSAWKCAQSVRSNAKGYLAVFALGLRPRRPVTNKAKYVVSLTTYAARLNKFHLVLESLIRQDAAVDYSVVVHLSQEDLVGGRIPERLSQYRAFGVCFVLHDENYRSYKKLVYEYGRDGDRVIITADDDIVYPRSWLRRLIDAHHLHPRCVVSYRAHFLELEGEGKLRPYSEMMVSKREDGDRVIPRYDLMPTGVSGVLYPPGSLDVICTKADMYLAYAPTADDIWFKMASLLQHTPCVQVERKNRHFPSVPNSQVGALYRQNVGDRRNDEQLAACFAIFPHLFELIERPVAAAGTDGA